MDNDKRTAAELPHLRGKTLKKGDPVSLPITLASMYHLPGDPEGYNQYGRFSNPTWEAVEHAIGHLEQAPTVVFPSGMAAIAAVLYATLKSGDRILVPSDGYYTTRVLAERFLAPMGVTMETRPTAEFCKDGFSGFALVFLETPSNPGLDVCDIREAADAARRANALLVVDNTTMTPYGQRPLNLGADMVVTSDTKALNGHSDVLFGHVASRNASLTDAVRDWRKLAGAIPGPFETWLVQRGLETLDVRLERMCRTAELFAERLADHAAVRSIRYPGLESDPAHEIAGAQMQTFGFLIGVTFENEAAAEAFASRSPFIQPATSFGGGPTPRPSAAHAGEMPFRQRLSVFRSGASRRKNCGPPRRRCSTGSERTLQVQLRSAWPGGVQPRSVRSCSADRSPDMASSSCLFTCRARSIYSGSSKMEIFRLPDAGQFAQTSPVLVDKDRHRFLGVERVHTVGLKRVTCGANGTVEHLAHDVVGARLIEFVNMGPVARPGDYVDIRAFAPHVLDHLDRVPCVIDRHHQQLCIVQSGRVKQIGPGRVAEKHPGAEAPQPFDEFGAVIEDHGLVSVRQQYAVDDLAEPSMTGDDGRAAIGDLVAFADLAVFEARYDQSLVDDEKDRGQQHRDRDHEKQGVGKFSWYHMVLNAEREKYETELTRLRKG